MGRGEMRGRATNTGDVASAQPTSRKCAPSRPSARAGWPSAAASTARGTEDSGSAQPPVACKSSSAGTLGFGRASRSRSFPSSRALATMSHPSCSGDGWRSTCLKAGARSGSTTCETARCSGRTKLSSARSGGVGRSWLTRLAIRVPRASRALLDRTGVRTARETLSGIALRADVGSATATSMRSQASSSACRAQSARARTMSPNTRNATATRKSGLSTSSGWNRRSAKTREFLSRRARGWSVSRAARAFSDLTVRGAVRSVRQASSRRGSSTRNARRAPRARRRYGGSDCSSGTNGRKA
mmetsp:Transcript_46292/g.109183  ORF Transcript_46292/g.109183 Transcript_46292/m.109183 type:complete len:300 (+) Transcript_46292:827-1726(+)